MIKPQSVTKGTVRTHREDEYEPPQDEPTIQRRETIYEEIKRVQESTEPESTQATQLVSIISELFLPYNIPVRYSGIALESDSKIDSKEYEWDTFFDVTKDIEVDNPHIYTHTL